MLIPAVCGGELTLSSTPLYIESPGYKQGPYRNHVTCSWRITVSNQQISAVILFSHLLLKQKTTL